MRSHALAVLLAVKFTLLPTAGILKDNGVTVTANQFVTVADINAGKLVFAPNSNLTGGPFFLCKFQVEDNGGTANGGVNLDPTAKVGTGYDIYAQRYSAAGVAQGNEFRVNAFLTSTQFYPRVAVDGAGNFGFSDPNDSPANALLSVVIDSMPGLGSLTDNGVIVTAGTHNSVVDINGGKLKFTPVANGTGSPYASFKFQVQDNGPMEH